MNKTGIVIVVVAALAGFYWWKGSTKEEGPDVEYRYGKVSEGELVRSISATGILVAQTSVDVKSKAGGKVIRLAVEEGSVVKAGDLVAEIDPADTKAAYDQAQADYQSSQARAEQARINTRLEDSSTSSAVRDAALNLDLARIQLKKAEVQAKMQPGMSGSSLNTALAALEAAKNELTKFDQVTGPQIRRTVASALERTRVNLGNAKLEIQRQRDLFQKGYAARNEVEQAESALASAQAEFDNAEQRVRTLEREIEAERNALNSRIKQSTAQVADARASLGQTEVAQRSLEEARERVRSAQNALKKAEQDALRIDLRQSEATGAQAATVRSRVTLQNAKVQLDSTTVTAPRDGVVTKKYLEEGTIIPPGTSTFSQGTSLVQISDITRMFVECAVDEADVAEVRQGQDVRIVVEAYPGLKLNGRVDRVNPAAETANNITAVKVRVEILESNKAKLMPGMNATCEFLTMFKSKVLVVPSQAVQKGENGDTVRIKGDDGKPKAIPVKLGEDGNEGIEVLDGLKPGQEVVVAEINLKQLRETQQKMMEAMQGGGLAGGGQRPGMGGGARPGGGAGAGRGGGAR